jgi:hypothetical protein
MLLWEQRGSDSLLTISTAARGGSVWLNVAPSRRGGCAHCVRPSSSSFQLLVDCAANVGEPAGRLR